MFDGKLKAVTFSYDDGVTQDIRLIEILNKYGLKGTFNLNSGLLGNQMNIVRDGITVSHNKVLPNQVRDIYKGHEVAAHTLTHPLLPSLPDEEVIRQVEEDRERLSELVGYDVVGMAYPCGGENHDDRVVELIKEHTGIKYCRTVLSEDSFDVQTDLYRFKPQAYHTMQPDRLFAKAEEFLALRPDKPQVFYIWGHSYELDYTNTWEMLEEFCKMISGKEDIFYGTNAQVLL